MPFEIAYAVDFDKWAVDTYNKNFNTSAVCVDVNDVDFNDVPDVDLMIGGFPCQSFSTANPGRNSTDDRAHLYEQIIRFLTTKKPKYFICENVKGLLTMQKGAVIERIVREFGECGYNVKYKLLKAVEYGIPQVRERVIIVGIRKDLPYNYKYPMPVNNEKNCVPLSMVIDSLVLDDKKYYFSQKAVEGALSKNNGWRKGVWQDLNGACLTITSHLAKTTMNSRDPILLVEPEKNLYRRFTPREAAKIQSFPDSFILNKSEAKAYKQIGNAVPPVFMWYVVNELRKAIENCDKCNVVNECCNKQELPGLFN